MIQVSRIEAFTDALAAVGTKLASSEALDVFDALGEQVAQTARDYAPEYEGPPRPGVYFQPGHLKGQINQRSGRDVATGAPWTHVGAPWYVGGFHEYGTEHEAAHPFMRPTADEWQPQVESAIAAGLAALIG